MLPRPAATILVLCDVASSFKVLMMKRHSKARFMPHAYVFPGGGAEATDAPMAEAALGTQLPLRSWRVTALRELAEETGIVLDASLGGSAGKAVDVAAATQIVPFAHWITPKQEKFRYDTWFFAAAAKPSVLDIPFTMDPAEVVDVKWVTPKDAIALHLDPNQEFFLPPPTYLIMHGLTRFSTSSQVINDLELKGYAGQDAETVVPAVEPTLEFEGDEATGKRLKRMHLQEGWTHLAKGRYQYPMVTKAGTALADVVVGGAADGAPSKL